MSAPSCSRGDRRVAGVADGVIAVACTSPGRRADTVSGGLGLDGELSNPPRPPRPTWVEPTNVMGAPDYVSDPDPDAAPVGVDTGRWRTHRRCNPTGTAPVRSTPPSASRTSTTSIFVVLENRSFDHYFGTFPGADGIVPADRWHQADLPARPATAPARAGCPTTTRTSSIRADRTVRTPRRSTSPMAR